MRPKQTCCIIHLLLLLVFPSCLFPLKGQENKNLKPALNQLLSKFGQQYASPRTIQVDSIVQEKRTLILYANEALEDIPFRLKNVSEMYTQLDSLCPGYARIILQTRGTAIEDLIPAYEKKGRPDKKKRYPIKETRSPLTHSLSHPYTIKRGLQNRHIALWQSHGMYYAQTPRRWEWQRARMFGTVEDLYPQSLVLPFLIPMLENAGANVLIPRERDTRQTEIIIDNDQSSENALYKEASGENAWTTAPTPGFANRKAIYTDGENPFRQGTFRQATTLKKGTESRIEWTPSIPETGEYAVYVSYHSLPNSAEQVFYTIRHAGGETTVAVNQTMGGGTWIYLGSFRFMEGMGEEGKVILTNRGDKAGKIVTADAVKIGGGMGNIARAPKESLFPVQPETSGYPRFTEAARYWLQWAGMPDSVYSETRFENDYRDDIFARGKWVNYLKGTGNIPIDMAFGFHTDAGSTPDDSIIGTLGIYMSKSDEGKYTNGQSREVARDLTDQIQSQIVSDIRQAYDPRWTRRGMWNQSYIEARLPDVPTMLLELLSHQNFADMRHGLDPAFRFLVSRAIYKGMLRHICFQNGQKAVIQPLPPRRLYTEFTGKNQVRIGWQATPDTLEPSARPTAYVVYTRRGDGGFDNGILVRGEEAVMPITPGTIYGYKVAAVNEGGISFPSEILSVYRPVGEEKGTVLIVNGFDRVRAPASFDNRADSTAGFRYTDDRGVPYLRDIAFIGDQYEFRRSAPWVTNDRNGFGDSYNHHAGEVIAGNSFDYPYIHGEAIARAGFAFVSCSRKSVEEGPVRMGDYPVVDWIAGKQRGPLFTSAVRDSIQAYLDRKGNLLMTGTYPLSDSRRSPEEQAFVTTAFKGKLASDHASREGRVSSCASPHPYFQGDYAFRMEPNTQSYSIESVDGLLPADPQAYTILRYAENNIGAGLVYEGAYRTCLLGFPLEALTTARERERLMAAILRFFQPEIH